MLMAAVALEMRLEYPDPRCDERKSDRKCLKFTVVYNDHELCRWDDASGTCSVNPPPDDAFGDFSHLLVVLFVIGITLPCQKVYEWAVLDVLARTWLCSGHLWRDVEDAAARAARVFLHASNALLEAVDASVNEAAVHAAAHGDVLVGCAVAASTGNDWEAWGCSGDIGEEAKQALRRANLDGEGPLQIQLWDAEQVVSHEHPSILSGATVAMHVRASNDDLTAANDIRAGSRGGGLATTPAELRVTEPPRPRPQYTVCACLESEDASRPACRPGAHARSERVLVLRNVF